MYSYYIYIINTLYFTAFFAPAVPLGLIFSIIGLIMLYCITKYIFLRRLCIPKKLGIKLCTEIIKMMEFIPLIYGISNMLFDRLVERESGSVSKFFIIFGVIYILLPMNWLNKKIFSKRKF